MGLAVLISISKIKHLIVIGFERIEQTSHTADIIKSKINQILSKYDFDRKKIIGIMCEQGSNFVSAFKSPPITTKEGIYLFYAIIYKKDVSFSLVLTTLSKIFDNYRAPF